ncbi:MAG: hypothetical protein R3F59_03845 [Myxococcota bacterium]
MRRAVGRAALRLAVAVAVGLAHRAVGGWLAALDPIALATGPGVVLVAGLALVLAPLRVAVWFVLPPWVVAGAAADWLDARDRARVGPGARRG